MHKVSKSLREKLTDAQIEISVHIAYEISRDLACYRSCDSIASPLAAYRASLMLAAARESTVED